VLAGVLFYIALIALVAMTILSAGLAMTRATIVRMAQPSIAAGYQRAATSLQQTIAAEMQSGGVPNPMPVFTPLPAQCANAACTYTSSETITLSSGSANAAAPNTQSNQYVTEGRLGAVITVTVKDSKGAVIAKRSGSVIVRTFAAPPYAAIAGAREGTFDDITSTHAAGDDGGVPPATPNPCASASAGVADDTTARVAYRNVTTTACADGGSWGTVRYSSAAPGGGWSP
jgi:hypothetical protein